MSSNSCRLISSCLSGFSARQVFPGDGYSRGASLCQSNIGLVNWIGAAMHGESHLKKTWQYARVYRTKKSWASRYLVMKTVPNGLTLSRYGISVSRRIGGAVVRNRVKRLFREILRQTPLEAGWDIVVIARQPSAEASYATLKTTVCELLSQARLLQEDNERACLTTD